MRLKWGSEQIDNFRMPTAEKENWLTKLINEYFYWVILAILISATGWIWWKIWELLQIHVWLQGI